MQDVLVKPGVKVEVEGQFRSYNSYENGDNRLILTVFAKDINGTKDDICAAYAEYYHENGLIFYRENASEDGFMSACAYSGNDAMEISVEGNDERILLISRFDNLGKGASGAAIQNMNIILGVDDATGLDV